jgi:hypothetical protein
MAGGQIQTPQSLAKFWFVFAMVGVAIWSGVVTFFFLR